MWLGGFYFQYNPKRAVFILRDFYEPGGQNFCQEKIEFISIIVFDFVRAAIVPVN